MVLARAKYGGTRRATDCTWDRRVLHMGRHKGAPVVMMVIFGTKGASCDVSTLDRGYDTLFLEIILRLKIKR